MKRPTYFVYSDQDCCNKCTRIVYDMNVRHTYCPTTQKKVEPYNPACLFFNRVLQGFGE